MKEQQRGATSREQLFEALYGYPPRLFDSVIAIGAIEDESVLAELVELHQQKLEHVNKLLEA